MAQELRVDTPDSGRFIGFGKDKKDRKTHTSYFSLFERGNFWNYTLIIERSSKQERKCSFRISER